ncbi:hypothetical protein OS493_006144 [Desmophyllum pertusum]|uniref:Uncharacterized protein n=1 Tax=Desmophyllum pertusum TaxID=174260 RepID=A0A9X0DBZ5_9CNID|nr:hypothetical protein OS493_006144 [Desmophyllum pertusum]
MSNEWDRSVSVPDQAKDSIPQQMARPATLGLDVSFLTRHTQDMDLLDSLYQNNDYLPSASLENTLANVDVGNSGLPSPYSFARSNGADSAGLVMVAESRCR